MRFFPPLPALALLALALPAPALLAGQTDVAPKVRQALDAGPPGTRYGLLVATLEGEPVVSIAPDERFIPASNTKMFTTAAAYADLPALDRANRGTGVRLEQGDVIVEGHGDARLSSAPDCVANCLRTLADAVAARTRRVRNVVGDDSWFPDERWGPGMSWNNIQSRYGTGISALTIDDNTVSASVTPGAIGAVAGIAASSYYAIDNRVTTVPGTARAIAADRAPNSRTLRLTGTIGAEAPPATLYFSIDDPAHYAAWRMRELLVARGVEVGGSVMTRHRPLSPADDPAIRRGGPAARPRVPEMLAELPPLPLADDMRIINKESQNLHADLMLRRVGRASGSGSIADGQAALDRVMAGAGVARIGYTFADGSGMSSYNRITPRAAVGLLTWIAGRPWGAAWRETLPIAGRDGTLRSRFKDTVLEGRLFAKTGSLNAARALSGYMMTRGGRTLVFSALANDMPDGTDAQASAAVDRALVAVAEAM